MKIKDLIEALEKEHEKHGNIEVKVAYVKDGVQLYDSDLSTRHSEEENAIIL